MYFFRCAFPLFYPGGKATIGIGVLIDENSCFLPGTIHSDYAEGWTKDEADAQFEIKLKDRGEDPVKRNVSNLLTQNEFDALVDAAYNGAAAPLWDMVKLNNYDAGYVMEKFMTIRTESGLHGKEQPGLISRRGVEGWFFLTGTMPDLNEHYKTTMIICSKKNTDKIINQKINLAHKWTIAWNNYGDKYAPLKPGKKSWTPYKK